MSCSNYFFTYHEFANAIVLFSPKFQYCTLSLIYFEVSFTEESCRFSLFSARRRMSFINNKHAISKYVYLTSIPSTLSSSIKTENSDPDKGFLCLILSLVYISSVKPNFIVTLVLIFSVNR